MKVDWSKLSKGHIIIWYIITIFVILGIAIFTKNLVYAIVIGHIGYSIFMGTSIIEYAIENRC